MNIRDRPTAYNGTYVRSRGGWCYVCSGQPVPGAQDLVREGVYSLWAPELSPDRLLDGAAVAALVGIERTTWTAYVSRGTAPKPVAKYADTPVWTSGQVTQWLRARPGQGTGGGRPRGRGQAQRPGAT